MSELSLDLQPCSNSGTFSGDRFLSSCLVQSYIPQVGEESYGIFVS
jgi:hypothetical protein